MSPETDFGGVASFRDGLRSDGSTDLRAFSKPRHRATGRPPLSPTSRHGSINDPLGHTKLMGTVVARADREQVNALLSQVQSTVAAAQAASPPPQPPTGSPSASSREPIE